MSAPSVLLLDVMGTLVHDPFYLEVPRFFGMSLDELVAVKHPTAWVEFERGEIDEAQLAAKFFADRRRLDLSGLERTMRRSYRLLPGIEPLLDRLRERGVPMHAFSNYPRWYRWIEESVGLSRWLQWTFVSCHTGHRKPEPQAYDTVVRTLKQAPEEMTLVDDRPDNCAGAQQAGMLAVRFSDAATLERSLRSLGYL